MAKGMSKVKIGTIDIPAGEGRKTYQTASWYRQVEYDAQTVDVFLERDYWVVYEVKGTATYDYFPSSFGGHQTGGGKIGPCNEPDTLYRMMYKYEWKAMLAQNSGAKELVA